MAENAPPGWYQSEADPPGTERYWDGGRWSEETRTAAPAPPPAVSPGARMTPHGRELASPGARIGARIVDSLLLAVVTAPFVAGQFDGALNLRPGAMLFAGFISAIYEVAFTVWKSATPGKMAVGIEIVRQDDGRSPLPIDTAVLRWLPFAVGNIPGISGFGALVFLASLILIFVDQYRRSVSDFVGRTYVVRKPRRM